MIPIYYTPQEVADILHVSYDKALDFIKHSGVKYVRVGRQYRISEEALNAYLNPPEKKRIPLRKP